MDYFSLIQTLGKDIKEFKKTKNFYFEDHICSADGQNKRVRLDYMLSCEESDEVLRFGICKDCGICFCHGDFISQGL